MTQVVTIDTADTAKSEKLFERAQKVIPGGVNSPVRALKAVGANPIFMQRGDGAWLYDVDGNAYVDYIGSWGPMILGHRNPRVLESLEETLINGTSFGTPSPGEVELAELITTLMPSIEMVRLVNSGTEATMSATRLARAYTKRDLIIKFDGCYHGHFDSFLVKAGSGLATNSIASSPGVPEELIKLTLSLPYNDLASVEKAFKEHKDKIAAVIVEPIAANCGLILPDEKFLSGLRDLTSKHGALLIFDEVITGFRVALGGAQAKYKIKADLTCLGKIIGGGLPVGAYGGKKEIMELVAPVGQVYQAGTLSGNPLATAAGLAQLRSLIAPNAYEILEQKTKRLSDGLTELIKKAKLSAHIVYTTGMLCLFFHKGEITDFEATQKCDTEKFANLWKALIKKGIYWPPSQFETAFISLEHGKAEIEQTLAAFEESFNHLKD